METVENQSELMSGKRKTNGRLGNSTYTKTHLTQSLPKFQIFFAFTKT